MLDILLCDSGEYKGDLDLTEDGDIQLGSNLFQNAQIAISWILGEWRLGPDMGLPWFEEILVKKPNLDIIRQIVIDAILDVDGITDADAEVLEYNSAERWIKMKVYCETDDENYSGEVMIGG